MTLLFAIYRVGTAQVSKDHAVLRVQYTEQITLHYQHPNSEAASKYNLVMDSQHKKSFLYYQGSSVLSTFFAPDKKRTTPTNIK